MSNPFTWPQDSHGKSKSIGFMTDTERVRVQGVLNRQRLTNSYEYIEVMAFLERQEMISAERLAHGGRDLYDDDGIDFR